MIEVKPHIDKYIKDNSYYCVVNSYGGIERHKYLSCPDIRKVSHLDGLKNLERFLYNGKECIKHNNNYYYASNEVLDDILRGMK